MKSKEKGFISLGVMVGISAVLIAGSDSVYQALSSIGKNAAQIGGLVPGTYEAGAQGFGGEVKAAVTIGDDGAIADIQITDCSTETDGIGQKAAPELAAAMLEAGSVEVDSVAGASITSDAVKEAVTIALEMAKTGEGSAPAAEAVTETEADAAKTETEETEAASKEETEAAEAEETETKKTETEAAETETAETEAAETEAAEIAEIEPTGGYLAGTYEAHAEGFGGDVKVAVVIGDAGELQAVQIVDYSSETPDVGQAAAPKLAAEILKAQSAEVDGVSGATITSDAVKKAVSDALAQAMSGEAASEKDTEEAADNAKKTASVGEYKAGTYEASADGFGGKVKIAVTIDKKGKIESVQVLDYSSETPDVGQKAALQLAGEIVKTQSAEVDDISGATMTSTAIKKAVEEALKEAGA
ncbi:MAG: FMN-binding protein [Eubacteriales bacterium]|nr:FMN-binding protein [Eubacteriales bacterium]